MERKKAVVTGASRGIGKGIARVLAAEGYDLALSYHSKEEEAQKVKTELEQAYGVQCFLFQAKLEADGAGVRLFKEASERLGRVDLLVNNAGITKFEHILDLTEETLDLLIALDFRNYILMIREAARHMAENGVRGSVVNITSSRGERAYPQDAVYGGLKAGLNRAIQSMALDVAPYGIRINNVAPGAIRIRTREEILQDDRLEVQEDFWDRLGQRIPLERSGMPEDIGKTVAFLASDAASYITGVTLRVDGGLAIPGMPEAETDAREDRGWGYHKAAWPEIKKKSSDMPGNAGKQRGQVYGTD